MLDHLGEVVSLIGEYGRALSLFMRVWARFMSTLEEIIGNCISIKLAIYWRFILLAIKTR